MKKLSFWVLILGSHFVPLILFQLANPETRGKSGKNPALALHGIASQQKKQRLSDYKSVDFCNTQRSMRISDMVSNSSKARPDPNATQESGSSATITGSLV